METSALKHAPEQETPRPGKEVRPFDHLHRKTPPIESFFPESTHSIPQEPGRGTLICRLPEEFTFNFEARVALDFAMRYKIISKISSQQEISDKLRQMAPEQQSTSTPVSTSLLNQFPEHHLPFLGTLGGGKDFIEIARSGSRYYLIIHTDARNLNREIKKACRTSHLPDKNQATKQALLVARTFGKANRQLIARELSDGLHEEISDTLQENGELPPAEGLTVLYRFQIP